MYQLIPIAVIAVAAAISGWACTPAKEEQPASQPDSGDCRTQELRQSQVDVSVSGLVTPSMQVAAIIAGKELPQEQLIWWGANYKAESDKDNAVRANPNAPRIDGAKVCHKDGGHGQEQVKVFTAMAEINMQKWSNDTDYYISVFAEGQGPGGLAGAFLKTDKAFQDEVIKNLKELGPQNTSEMRQIDGVINGILIMLSVWVPITGPDKAIVIGGWDAMGNSTDQQDFALVMKAGDPLNRARAAFDKYTTAKAANNYTRMAVERGEVLRQLDAMDAMLAKVVIANLAIDQQGLNSQEHYIMTMKAWAKWARGRLAGPGRVAKPAKTAAQPGDPVSVDILIPGQ